MHFLRQSVKKKHKPKLAADARHALTSYSWPGNAGELETVMEHAAASVVEDTVTAAVLPDHVVAAGAGAAAPDSPSSFRGESLKKFLKQELADRGVAAN